MGYEFIIWSNKNYIIYLLKIIYRRHYIMSVPRSKYITLHKPSPSTQKNASPLTNNNNESAPPFALPQLQHVFSQKIAQYESQIAELKTYVYQSKQLIKEEICFIFKWDLKYGGVGLSGNENLLKTLGHKIKSNIKSFNKEKNKYSKQQLEYIKKKRNLQEIINAALSLQKDNIQEKTPRKIQFTPEEFVLEKTPKQNKHQTNSLYSNEDLNICISPVRKSTPGTIKRQEEVLSNKDKKASSNSNQAMLQEQRYYRENKPDYNSYSPRKTQENSTKSEGLNFAQLKKHLLSYMNMAIEGNDENLMKLQTYLNTLEKRVAKVQIVEKHLQHLIFEKTVKMQESSRKSKNYCFGAPKITGDQAEHEEIPPFQLENIIQNNQPNIQIFYAQKQPQKHDDLATTNQQLQALQNKNKKLSDRIEQLTTKWRLSQQKLSAQSSENESMKIQCQRQRIKVIQLQNQLQHAIFQFENHKQKVNKKRMETKDLISGIEQFQQQIYSIYQSINQCKLIHYQRIEREYHQLQTDNRYLNQQYQILKNNLKKVPKSSHLLIENTELKEKYQELQQEYKQFRQKMQHSSNLQNKDTYSLDGLQNLNLLKQKLQKAIEGLDIIVKSFKENKNENLMSQ